jgi:hypothetical protein
MSSKYVKKLLAVTAEPLETSKDIVGGKVVAPLKKRKRAKRKIKDTTPLADASIKLRNLHVRTMLGLDELAKKKKLPTKTTTDLTKSLSKSSQTKKQSVVGNTRSSSSTMLQELPPIPTFRKHQYLRQKKEAKLKEMAILLRKAKKEMIERQSQAR